MRITLFLSLFLVTSGIFGQIELGYRAKGSNNHDVIIKSDLESLKKTKTIFVYKNSDKLNLDLLEESLREVWDLTELEFVSYDRFIDKEYDENYSFFTIGTENTTTTYSSGKEVESVKLCLILWMKKNDKKLYFCRIDLFPDNNTFKMTEELALRDQEQLMEHVYTESVIYNWSIYYLKNILQFAVKYIKNSETNWIYYVLTNMNVSNLKNDTLYIPDYVFINFIYSHGDKIRKYNSAEFLKKYPHPYKILSEKDITEKILNSSEPVYYLTYLQCDSKKSVLVINSQTGDIVFDAQKKPSYSLEKRDFRILAKAIGK